MTRDTTMSFATAESGSAEPPPDSLPMTKSHDDSGQNLSLYANKHIPKFLALQSTNVLSSSASDEKPLMQVVSDGRQLTSESLMSSDPSTLSLSHPILVTDAPTSIGMRVPQNKNKRKEVSVRDIAEILGTHTHIAVIDVKDQRELEGWTLGDMVDQFEDPQRLMSLRQMQEQINQHSSRRPRRAAAQNAFRNPPKVVNQISLEFSRTPLHRHVQSPDIVRDLDWIDHVWPQSRKDKGDYPVVQYYCLTSTAGCYTDFHIDFGGTSVWYHILSGRKTFVLIPPTPENLQAYEAWLCHPHQHDVFLPDLLPSDSAILKVTLEPTQTMIIPTGWIHAVHTPVDSVVLGGNFLHGWDMKLQLDVYCIESRTRVPDRFRFPHFVPIMFYAAGMYLEKLKKGAGGNVTRREAEQLGALIPCLKEWWKVQSDEAIAPAAQEAARRNQCATVEDMLYALECERARRLGLELPRPMPPTRIVSASVDRETAPLSLVVPKKKSKLRIKIRLSGSSAQSSQPNSSSTTIDSTEDTAEESTRSTAPPEPMLSLAAADLSKKRKLPEKDSNVYETFGEDDEWQLERKSRSNKRAVSGLDQLSPRGAAAMKKCASRSAPSSKKLNSARNRLKQRLG